MAYAAFDIAGRKVRKGSRLAHCQRPAELKSLCCRCQLLEKLDHLALFKRLARMLAA
jgi:hypothetical protein